MATRDWAALLTLVSVLFGCGADPQQAESSAYLPLGVNNRWVYEEQKPDSHTGVVVPSGVRTKEVAKTEEYAGRETFVLRIYPADSYLPTKRFNWIVENGATKRLRSQELYDGEVLYYQEYKPGFLRYHEALATPGDSLAESHVRSEYDPSGFLLERITRSYVWTVEAVDEEVTVPAGTFSCLRLARQPSEYGGQRNHYWYAKGVGKVLEEKYDGSKEVLLEYTLHE